MWNDAKALMVSLLTDPKIKDEDYMFFGDDPLAPPPDNLRYVKDLNTGCAYRKTFAKLITNVGKQVLLPVIFYIDGVNTGHFADLPVTAVKFPLESSPVRPKRRNTAGESWVISQQLRSLPPKPAG